MNLLKSIFDLAEHEKNICMLGAFNSDDKSWIIEALGLDENLPIDNDDLGHLCAQDMVQIVFDFIEHCEEMKRSGYHG